MKKLLLALTFAATSVALASAQSSTNVTFDFTNPGASDTPYTLSPKSFDALKEDPKTYTYQTDKTKYWRINLTGESINCDGVTIIPTTTGSNWPRFFFNTKQGVVADDWNWEGTTAAECGFDCDFRIYNPSTIKITAPEECKITKVVFTGYRFNASTVYEFQNVAPEEGTPGEHVVTEKGVAPYTNTWTYAAGLDEVTFVTTGTTTQICRKITVTLESATTGIDDIRSNEECSSARYYNLQGTEVQNPTSGIYIKVSGNKASKVLL